MPNATVKQYQNLFDIAVLNCGDVTAVFALANLNGKSLTDELVSGEALALNDAIDKDVVSQLAAKKAKPATGSIAVTGVGAKRGIGHWIIEKDFKVS